MRACDEKLSSSLKEVMDWEEAKLEAEMQNMEPHVFSKDFEERMDKLIQSQRRKAKYRGVGRMAAACMAVMLLVGSMIFIGSEELGAGKLGIDIREWLARYFTVEHDNGGIEEEVNFNESQLTYIPDGLRKVSENISPQKVHYKYQNERGDYFYVHVVRSRAMHFMDSEEVEPDVKVNEMGYEYTLNSKENQSFALIMWEGEDNLCYTVAGNIANEELIKVMNGISY